MSIRLHVSQSCSLRACHTLGREGGASNRVISIPSHLLCRLGSCTDESRASTNGIGRAGLTPEEIGGWRGDVDAGEWRRPCRFNWPGGEQLCFVSAGSCQKCGLLEGRIL